jgi:hypothetical protein
MLRKCISTFSFAAALTIGVIAGQAVAQEKAAAPQAKPTDAKICINCHKPEAGNIRGYFENVAFKSQSIQIKIDEAVEIVKFDPGAIKVIEAAKPAEAEALRSIKKGHEVRVEYTEKGGVKTATLVATKPPIKVAPEKLLSTADVEKLVAMGTEKGKYFLVDSRPAPRFQEGAISTAVSIPDFAFEKMKDRLPADKNIQLVFYCGGST